MLVTVPPMAREQGELNLSSRQHGGSCQLAQLAWGLLDMGPSSSIQIPWLQSGKNRGFPHGEVACKRDACLGPDMVEPVWCCNSLSLGQVELEGLTGHIEFNSKGQRSNYALKILQFTRNGFRQVSLPVLPR